MVEDSQLDDVSEQFGISSSGSVGANDTPDDARWNSSIAIGPSFVLAADLRCISGRLTNIVCMRSWL